MKHNILKNNVKKRQPGGTNGIMLLVLLLIVFSLSLLSAQNNPADKKKDTRETEEKLRALVIKAKRLVASKEWSEAIKSFKHIAEHYSGSKWEPQAMYWTAFSLNKLNGAGREALERKEEALYRLAELTEKFPGNQWVDDAKRLRLEIAEDLAAKGYGKYKKYLEGEARKKEADDLKISAIDALMHMDKNKALPVLEKLLRTHKEAYIRKKVLFSLGQHQDPKVVQLLSFAATSDPSETVRKSAIFWLGQYRSPESFKELLKIYDATPPDDLKIKKNLLFSIIQSNPEKGAEHLIKIYKKEKNLRLKKEIIFYLGQSESEKAQAFIIEILENMP